MQNLLTYKLGLKNDTNYQFIANRTLAKRRNLFEKYNNDSQVVVICEPHRLQRQFQTDESSEFPIFVFVFSKKDPVERIFKVLKQKLKSFQKVTLCLLCNNQMLSQEQIIGIIYEKQKNQEDGLLYVKYCSQETFGKY